MNILQTEFPLFIQLILKIYCAIIYILLYRMGTQSENQFRAEARDANNEIKGGVISEFIFNFSKIFF